MLCDDTTKMLRICSFNCRSLKNSLVPVQTLCNSNDIVFLQETWLSKFELSMLNGIHPEFIGLGISAFDSSSALLAGRPYGGLAILWRKSLHPSVSAQTHSDRIMQIDIMTEVCTVSLFNVYLPTDYHDIDSHDQFGMCIGELSCYLDVARTKTSYLGVIGDCNANSYGSPFFSELMTFCSDNGLLVSDLLFLGPASNTYTYVSAAHGSTSWLDHCLCSPNLHSTIDTVSIVYDVSIDDHMPLMVRSSLKPATTVTSETVTRNRAKPQWKKITHEEIVDYNDFLLRELGPGYRNSLITLSDCTPACEEGNHLDVLHNCYSQFVETVNLAGSCCIKQSRGGQHRVIPGWNEHVKCKHSVARQFFLQWRACGSPKEGSLATLMRQTRLSFKYSLRKCKRDFRAAKANKISACLSNKRQDQFWSLIKQEMNGSTTIPLSFGAITGNDSIASMWKNHFETILNDPTCGSDNETFNVLSVAAASPVPPISPHDVQGAVAKLKGGKAPGWDLLCTDHLMHLGANVLGGLSVLFNVMMNHSVLPSEFTYSLLAPLVKDKSGALDDRSNYRAIALSTTLSKILELILVERMAPFLVTGDAQFGFKANHSTTLATYVLKETVHHYISQGGPVYACFLDATKAFDRVCHSKLFRVLADRKVPLPYLKLLWMWYRTQQMGVKWANSESDAFSVQNGVRQGGNLSPLLFNVYIDSILSTLRGMRVGCHIGPSPVNVIAYADDVVLLAPTRSGLQILVQKCEQLATELDISFNTKKTVCMMFAPLKSHLAVYRNGLPSGILLNGQSLAWVKEFRYLGHMITCNLSDSDDMRRVKRFLYYGTNMICAKLGYADKHVLVRLFKTFCACMYGCELWSMVGGKKAWRELCVAYHSCLKKLVNAPRWSRNHTLCNDLKLLTCPMLVAYRQMLFWQRVNGSQNSLVISLTNDMNSTLGPVGKNHNRIRADYDLLELDLSAVSKADLRNVFSAHLERIALAQQNEA